MSVPLSDTRLSVRAEILAALSGAGAFCGECGFEPGETGCADCVRVRGPYADAVMPIVDQVRAQLGDWVAAVGQHQDDAARALGLLERGDTRQLGSLLARMAGGEHELPQRESLQAENERLRAEVAVLRACDCYPNPNDHADRCPIFLAAQPASETW